MVKKQQSLFQDLKNTFSNHFKRDKERTNHYKNIVSKLSPNDYLMFQDFKQNLPRTNPFFWLVIPFKAAFYLGIFGIVMLFAFNINLLDPFKIIISEIFKIYFIFIIVMFFELLLYEYSNKKRCEDFLDRF